MVDSELHDVFSSAQRRVKSMEPSPQSGSLKIIPIQRYDNAQNDLKCRPHARRGDFSFLEHRNIRLALGADETGYD